MSKFTTEQGESRKDPTRVLWPAMELVLLISTHFVGQNCPSGLQEAQEAQLKWKCDFLPRRTWNHKNKIQPASASPSPTSTVQPTSFFSRFSQNILCRNCFLLSLTQTGRHGYWVGLLWLHRLTEAELWKVPRSMFPNACFRYESPVDSGFPGLIL